MSDPRWVWFGQRLAKHTRRGTKLEVEICTKSSSFYHQISVTHSSVRSSFLISWLSISTTKPLTTSSISSKGQHIDKVVASKGIPPIQVFSACIVPVYTLYNSPVYRWINWQFYRTGYDKWLYVCDIIKHQIRVMRPCDESKANCVQKDLVNWGEEAV